MKASSTKRRGTLVEMSVIKVSPYLRVEKPLLWLCEKNADVPRLLPIAIGEFEAAAIQMKVSAEEPLRPISYDLFKTMLEHIEAPVQRAVIHSIHDATFYAAVVIEVDGALREIDSRPSDAIAMALRADVPVFATGQVLDIAAFSSEGSVETAIERFYELEPQIVSPELNESEQGLGIESPVDAVASLEPSEPPSAVDRDPEVALNSLVEADEGAPTETNEDGDLRGEDLLTLLRNRLETAVMCEEYEEAAALRDEIARFEQSQS